MSASQKLRPHAMQLRSTNEMIQELQRATLSLAIGFERCSKLPRSQQADALRYAAVALVEMRRVTDDLALRLR